MNDLNISIVQADLVWENPGANRAQLDAQFATIRERTDVVVLCEMFTTGFSMASDRIAELHHTETMVTLNWMRQWAQRLDAAITGSVSVREGADYFNRLYWVLPDGRINTYDKRHTFSMAGENLHYSNGQSRIIEEWRGWKICPLICYDLRFPVWSRNSIIEGVPAYDLLIYVANWPMARREPWMKLLLARAIENQSYVAGVNRIGVDGNGNQYSGDSAIINPRGEYMIQMSEERAGVETISLSHEILLDFREKFPVLLDADDFTLGSVQRR